TWWSASSRWCRHPPRCGTPSSARPATSSTPTSPRVDRGTVLAEVSFSPPSGAPMLAVPAGNRDAGAATSVLKVPAGPTIPLNRLSPEAALRRLELTVVRRLGGFRHGDHLGLLPGPGSDTNDARVYQPGQDDVRKIAWAV